ncbi:GNAT family N-acetyltransferase [Rhodococcus xishaensis]|uniref:N-acetyltransferase n=1 Tax=Rhodococcus xishaensis TaxID=2487364 RepID=A0A3S3CTK3_9NOCA|nr:GNAT family protein [Rhodococcus xishaensis]RVW05302.1 N-acetyltransferase [Rhodococcus xishaensis]
MDQISELDRFDPVQDPRPADEPWPELIWPISPDTELTGDVVQLNSIDPTADSAELFRALDHDDVWSHVPGRPRDPQDFAEILSSRHTLPEWNTWVVRTRRAIAGLPAGAIVGTSSYLDVSVHDARLEIGYTLYTPAVWSSSVNPETKLLLLGHAFDALHAGRVQMKTDTRNHRSQQAIARPGAQYEGTLRRHFRRSDGTVRDSVIFSVSAEDWPDVRQRLTSRLRSPLSAK